MKITRNNQTRLALSFALGLLAIGSLVAAATIPVELPPPDAKPPAKDKPVKVYILSGQSNMVGFGAVKPYAVQYANVFLSADPAVKPTLLPVGGAALLKHGVYEATASIYEGDYNPETDYSKLKPVAQGSVALGDATAQIHSLEGRHSTADDWGGRLPAIIVNAFIEVPYDGNYELHVGHESSSYAVAELDGKEVYCKGDDGQAKLTKVTLQKGQRYPLRIAYHDGGSAALWLEQVDRKSFGDLGWVVDELGRFRYLRGQDGTWVKRPDVFLNDAYIGKGQSAPHSVDACGPTFGPELGFGFVMGTFHDEPVIVLKACEGNRSLGWDILPPGSKSYAHEGKVYPGYGETLDEAGNVVKPAPGQWYAGKQYDDFTTSIHAVLDSFGERYPQFKDQGYEVAGFVWWQGHKDGGSPAHVANYEQNLANLIKAWRKEFKVPNAPWTIATVAFHGKDLSENYVQIAQAQLNVADPQRHPEFAGNVKTIDARPFWREANISPKNQDYHYNHNAETYMLCGDALGRAMVELKGGKVEYPEPGMTKPVEAAPFMWQSRADELTSMIPAIKPIVIDRLLPEFVGATDKVPAYLRRGMSLADLLAGKRPAKPTPVIFTQLDQVIEHYELCGIDKFSWKPFGPEMKQAEWQYFTFDPAEKKETPEGDRYREVSIPKGSENWFAVDFDAPKAGWKTGKAPFGQNDGKQEALSSSCKVPYCGCGIAPATLWDKEVLLMRQTFEVPKLKEHHSYRIVVGGAGHPWSGEGFALYLNGKLVGESKSGYYKSGGDVRGALVLEELLPEFAEGKVTIAAKGFLRRNRHRDKAAPPSGHLSVWIEEQKLPPLLISAEKSPLKNP